MKGKMAIVGDGDGVLAFSSVGVEAFAVKNAEEAAETVKKLASDYAVIFITDELARAIEHVTERYVNAPYPIILPVPAKSGAGGYGSERIRAAMEKALGVDVFINNDKEN
ncbi:MAG TPA: V-type ATP synthase subunit F [Clostridiales bacterium]|nr:V-type ATP synthase subunit F [Clostridiales bacterium]